MIFVKESTFATIQKLYVAENYTHCWSTKKNIVKFKTITCYLDFQMNGSKSCFTGIQSHFKYHDGKQLELQEPWWKVEVLGAGSVSEFQQVFSDLLFSFLLKQNKKPTSHTINNLLFRTTLMTGNKHPVSLGLCNLDTWSQKQFPYQVDEH